MIGQGGVALELRQLRYFVTVAREGTYGKASIALHVAQPALSRQIRKLEQELGVDLFVRHPHGVTLTPAARQLTSRIERILADLAQLKQSAGAFSAAISSCVKVGVSPGTAEILAYPLSKLTAARHPGLRCQFVSMLMPARADLLREGKVNLAVMNHPRQVKGLRIIPIMREPLCLLHHPDDTRFPPKTIRLEQLSGVPLVLAGETSSGIRASLQEAFARSGLPMTVAAEANTAGACKALVREGVAPTVHVAAMAAGELARGELRAVELQGLYSTRVIALPLSREPTAETRIMMRLVRDCLSRLIDDGHWLNGEMIPLDEPTAALA